MPKTGGLKLSHDAFVEPRFLQKHGLLGCPAGTDLGFRSEVRKLGEVSPTNGEVSNLLI